MKNHNSRDQTNLRRKSYKDASTPSNSLTHEYNTGARPTFVPEKHRRYSESSTCTYLSEAPMLTPTLSPDKSHNFLFNDVFNEIAENQDANAVAAAVVNDNEIINTMNFNEMSDCIVTIENNHHQESEQLHQQHIQDQQKQHLHHQQHFKLNSFVSNANNTVVDDEIVEDINGGDEEFVSFECVKKLLGEQNLDYIDSAIQSQFRLF